MNAVTKKYCEAEERLSAVWFDFSNAAFSWKTGRLVTAGTGKVLLECKFEERLALLPLLEPFVQSILKEAKNRLDKAGV